MRQVPFSKIIGKSIEHSKTVMFSPFSPRKWLKLLLIAFLAGALSSGMTDFNRLGRPLREGPPVSDKANPAESAGTAVAPENPSPAAASLPRPVTGMMIVTGMALFLLGIGIFVLMTWLNARFKFVWFHALVRNSAAVTEPFKLYRAEAFSLFRFLFLWSFGILFFAGIFLAFPVYMAFLSGAFKTGVLGSVSVVAGFFAPLLLPMAAFVILAGLVYMIVEDFVVPIMAMDRVAFTEAYRKFLAVYQSSRKDLWLYVLCKVGLMLVSGAGQLMLAVALVLCLVFAAGVLFGLPYLFLVLAMKLNWLFWLWAALLMLPFAGLVFVLFMSLSLPFAVFFRAFSLFFLTALECGYTPLRWDEAAR